MSGLAAISVCLIGLAVVMQGLSLLDLRKRVGRLERER